MTGSIPVYMRAHCKTGIVASRRGSIAHFPVEFRTWFDSDGTARFRARYLCRAATNDAVILSRAEDAATMCAACEDARKGPCVYRCFDSGARVIYIGSAKSRLNRLTTHESQSPWWPEVAEVTAEHFPTLFEARVAERLAIEAEAPLYNKQYRRAA